jgi:SAM-dependent methyltransferase
MDWRLKALMQLIFSYMPFGEKINYAGQRYLIKNLPFSDQAFSDHLVNARIHFEQFRNHGKPLESPVFYEFGVGFDLLIPLAYYFMGIDQQIVVDIRPVLRIELLNDTLRRLYLRQHEIHTFSRFMNEPIQIGNLDQLKEIFGIQYLAPYDARNIPMIKANSVDFISSSGVLEHVPEIDVLAIIEECERLLKPGSIMSHHIGYHDHYYAIDHRISAYNFYKYDDLTWRLFSPPLHYQNRLRHKDYIAMIRDNTSLRIVDEIIYPPQPKQVEKLRQIKLHKRFSDNYSFEELKIQKATIVLKKGSG